MNTLHSHLSREKMELRHPFLEETLTKAGAKILM